MPWFIIACRLFRDAIFTFATPRCAVHYQSRQDACCHARDARYAAARRAVATRVYAMFIAE